MASPNSGATSPYAPALSGGFAVSEQQFGVPLLGGSVGVLYANVTYLTVTDTLLFTLPTGAVILQWLVNVVTAFNDTGTDLLNIGGAATSTYALSLDVGSGGQITAGYVASKLFATPLGTDTRVTAKYTGGNGNASAGAATVAVFYALMGG